MVASATAMQIALTPLVLTTVRAEKGILATGKRVQVGTQWIFEEVSFVSISCLLFHDT